MQVEGLHIRLAEPDDSSAIHEIFSCPNVVSGALQLPYPSRQHWQQRLAEPDDGTYYLVAVVGQQVVGMLGVHTYPNKEENIAKAERIAGRVSDLAAVALPYVERFATLTDSTADDEFIAAAAKMNKTVGEIMDEEDPDKRRGLVLGLIGQATRQKLASLVEGSGGQKIKIGDISIRVPDDVESIAGNLFDAGIQLAFSLFVKPNLPKPTE